MVSLGSAFGMLLIAANWTNILATATKTAASMQAFYNAVMAANPIARTAAAVLVLVSVLYAGVAAFNKLTGSSISATGIITGAFATVGAFVFNGVLVPLQNGFAAFVNFLANAFNNPLAAIKIAFYDMAITVMQYLQNIAQGLEGLLNKIPGVTVDLTSGVNATVTKLQRDRKYEKWASGYTEVVKPWENIDLGKAYKAGRDWGANLGKSGLMGAGTGELEIPQAADVKDLLGNIDKNTGKIAKTVDLSDEQIKMLVDVAERKYVNNVNLTSQTPHDHRAGAEHRQHRKGCPESGRHPAGRSGGSDERRQHRHRAVRRKRCPCISCIFQRRNGDRPANQPGKAAGDPFCRQWEL